ncbi:hypothetical protein WJX72_006574 [[Myrmecia] bisecta]|uniref:Uncharacterized protein n=1 Tax=[Myrmecia] bisecta TaxID=41462 RepID=A0AAW1Q1L3_9CHLO
MLVPCTDGVGTSTVVLPAMEVLAPDQLFILASNRCQLLRIRMEVGKQPLQPGRHRGWLLSRQLSSSHRLG